MLIDLAGREAVAVEDYRPANNDPIAVAAGEIVTPDATRKSDLFGWIWCAGPDGREGWAPLQWIDRTRTPWRMKRDFDARELTLKIGDRLVLLYGESGFAMARGPDGKQGWAAMGLLQSADNEAFLTR
ncbi:MAG: hypothetical protein KDD85_07870 [Parvularculaceae bacterium]|nr:hypothetical protein [Parvularculaceae bacterium]